jgi:hypothetical protein
MLGLQHPVGLKKLSVTVDVKMELSVIGKYFPQTLLTFNFGDYKKK